MDCTEIFKRIAVIAIAFVCIASPVACASQASERIDAIIATGQDLVGMPYKPTAQGPDAFDCSGFVKYCMESVGCPTANCSRDQSKDDRYEKITDLSEIERGDMLFFDTTGNGSVDHAAIYVGNGEFIEASKKAGKVRFNSFTEWYEQRFICARRPRA